MPRIVDYLSPEERSRIDRCLSSALGTVDAGSPALVAHKADIDDLLKLYNDGNDSAQFDPLDRWDIESYDEEQMMIIGDAGFWLKCGSFGVLLGTDQGYFRMSALVGISEPREFMERYGLIPIARISNGRVIYIEDSDLQV